MAANFLQQWNAKRIERENVVFNLLRKISLPLARVAFFIVFFWFGILKIMELSPSAGVVHTIYEHTLWFMPWKLFIFLFGAYECLIGMFFLWPGKEKWALYMLIPHMIVTFGPLIILPKLVWKGLLVPNLIGQYIIKNLVIIALAIFMAAYVADGEDEQAQAREVEGLRKIRRA